MDYATKYDLMSELYDERVYGNNDDLYDIAFEGVVDKIKDIGAWLKKHVVDPIVNAFKKFLGLFSRKSPKKYNIARDRETARVGKELNSTITRCAGALDKQSTIISQSSTISVYTSTNFVRLNSKVESDINHIGNIEEEHHRRVDDITNRYESKLKDQTVVVVLLRDTGDTLPAIELIKRSTKTAIDALNKYIRDINTYSTADKNDVGGLNNALKYSNNITRLLNKILNFKLFYNTYGADPDF